MAELSTAGPQTTGRPDGAPETSGSPRQRILDATAGLLAAGGQAAATTRAISAAAGVQPQTIYRQFGDLQGLLSAVAQRGYAGYLAAKRAAPRLDDPVGQLRYGWDLHVEFGTSNPALYQLMYGSPDAGQPSPPADEAYGILLELVGRAAQAGRLRVDVPTAAAMIHSASVGVVLTLIAAPDEGGDEVRDLSARVREAILAAVCTGAGRDAGQRDDIAARAVALRAVAPRARDSFSPAEFGLLTEWLDRIARGG